MFEVQSAIRPYSPPSRAAQLFVRIQVNMVVVVGDEIGGDEQKEEKSKSGTPKRDMTSKMR